MLNALGFDVGKEDGIFGASTSRAVRDFQRNVGARVDGIVGLDTVRSLEGLRPTLAGPGRALVREAEAASRMGETLPGSIVAVDPGHGPSDRGVQAHGLVEAEVVAVVASSLCAELERRGARAIPLRGAEDDPNVGDRARRANASGATVYVSLHAGGGELAPAGAVCCYFGSLTTHSPMGRALAESILGELAAIGLREGGVRPLTISVLRETRMPAVQVELAVLTDPDDAAAVREPGFAGRAAVAIADGIERFLGSGSAVAAEAARDGG
jgi:N-acetylmuramoyl-L-alanine amidase